MPAFLFMSKPFTERIAGGNLFHPVIDASLFFFKTSWPETINQNSCAIIFSWFFINPFYLKHGKFKPPFTSLYKESSLVEHIRHNRYTYLDLIVRLLFIRLCIIQLNFTYVG